MKFPYSEQLVGEKLGLPRETMKSLRRTWLRKRVHWSKGGKKGVEIALSIDGVRAICERAGIEGALTIDLATCQFGANGHANGTHVDPICPEEMTVVALFANERLLLAKDTHGVNHRVIVGKSENFVRGMKLPVIPDAGNPGWLKLFGKLPRAKNRWK